MSIPLKIKGISTSKHELREFALTILYFSGLNQWSKEVYTCIRYKVYLVDGLKTNMHINNNMLDMESFFINPGTSLAYIRSCSIDIHISAKHLPYFFIYKVLANTTTIILPMSESLIPFKQILLLDSQDFFFHPALESELTFYAYLIDHIIYKVLVCNNPIYYIQVSKNHKLSYITNLAYNNYLATRIELNTVAYLPVALPYFISKTESQTRPLTTI